MCMCICVYVFIVYVCMCVGMYSGRNKDQKLVGCFFENPVKIWPTKMDFGQPIAEIGWKMANGQLLFLALCTCMCVRQ